MRVVGTNPAEQVFSVYAEALTQGYILSIKDNQGAGLAGSWAAA